MQLKRLISYGVVAAALSGAARLAVAQAVLVTVTPSNMVANGWAGQVSGDTTLQFLTGAGAQFTVTSYNEAGVLRLSNTIFAMKLSELVYIGYNTRAAGRRCDLRNPRGRVAPYLALDIDSDGDFFADDVLIFDPGLNGAVSCGVWQTWNATTGLWYSSAGALGRLQTRSLATYIAAHPNATLVLGGIRIMAGGNSPEWMDTVTNVGLFMIERSASCTPAGCVSGPAPTYLFTQGP